MNEVTQLLDQIGRGDPVAADKLLPLVYDELRRLAANRLAREQQVLTLQPTALVHEAYVRLAGSSPSQQWEHRGHFFAAAAEAMRRILVEHARRRQSRKHGGHMVRAGIETAELPAMNRQDPAETLAIHEVLDQLARHAPRKAELVKLRYFLGCTMAEAAEILGIARATAEEDWTYARAWLRRQWLRAERDQ